MVKQRILGELPVLSLGFKDTSCKTKLKIPTELSKYRSCSVNEAFPFENFGPQKDLLFEGDRNRVLLFSIELRQLYMQTRILG